MATQRAHHTEAQLETLFRLRVREQLGGQVVKMPPVMAGTPDRLVLLPGGRMYLVELKTVTGRLSPLQTQWHLKASALGTTVHVLYGLPGIVTWLNVRKTEYDLLLDDFA